MMFNIQEKVFRDLGVTGGIDFNTPLDVLCEKFSLDFNEFMEGCTKLTETLSKELIVSKARAERQELLDNGMTTADGEFWFNEKWATVFMTKTLSAEFVGLPSIQWKDAKGIVVEVALEDAKVYIKEMIEALDKVYLG